MNIKDKIQEWQEVVKYDRCASEQEELELDKELELIFFVIDNLKDKALNNGE